MTKSPVKNTGFVQTQRLKSPYQKLSGIRVKGNGYSFKGNSPDVEILPRFSWVGRRAIYKGNNLLSLAVNSLLKEKPLLLKKDSLRKHACSNIQKILSSKNENFQINFFDILHISAQNIDCGYPLEPPRRGGFNKYPQPMFLSRNKKNNVYPFKPQFYYKKVGFKGVKII